MTDETNETNEDETQSITYTDDSEEFTTHYTRAILENVLNDVFDNILSSNEFNLFLNSDSATDDTNIVNNNNNNNESLEEFSRQIENTLNDSEELSNNNYTISLSNNNNIDDYLISHSINPIRTTDITNSYGIYTYSFTLNTNYYSASGSAESIEIINNQSLYSEKDESKELHIESLRYDHNNIKEIITPETCCSICLNDYQNEDQVSKLFLCTHWFHTSCIKEWYKYKPDCPICRKKIEL